MMPEIPETSVKPIPAATRTKIEAAWQKKKPAVAAKLKAAKTDSAFRQAILEAHDINETSLNIRVGG